jgi:hypothetical protein
MDAMKRFEEKIAENIARAFDAYQEPVDEQAFAQLQARLRERRRRVFWLPLYYRLAAAAAVLGIAGLAWVLWPAASAEEPPLTTVAGPGVGVPWRQAAPAPVALPALPPAGQDAARASSQPAPRALLPLGPASSSLQKEEVLTPRIEPEPQEWVNEAPLPAAALAEVAETPADGTPAGHEALPAAADPTLEAIAAVPVAETEARAAEPAPGPLPALADSASIWSEATRIEPARQRATVELLASAGGNIAEQQLASGMGWRAGLLYHRPLSPALSLSSGLLFAHNRMSFAPASQLDLQQVETINPNQIPTTSSNTQQQVVDRHIAARYSSLEMPVNLRYAWRQKSGKYWYASLGLSSLWYLRQGFAIEQDIVTTNFFQDPNSLEPTFNVERETVLAQESPAPLRTINLAGLVNASLAFPLDLGGRSLWIEPYLQVPTGQLTARQFAFGSGGVSFKYTLAKLK